MNFRLSEFEIGGKKLRVRYVESMNVTNGVVCHVYQFEGDNTRDLAIIEIEKGKKTPRQKVLQGDKTIEGFLKGKGELVITNIDGIERILEMSEKTKLPFEREVKVGEIMQWRADSKDDLLVYEICYPPYRDGRYENISG